ncbi:MAG: FAD-dependent thymidylate synthase [Desulfobacterota bacterium]|nr:FAD-dependent thymidylate synthase [Thermodesulfobacteriota bacterium]
MTAALLKVSLLECTKNPLSVIYAAYRQCYSEKFAADMHSAENIPSDHATQFVKTMVTSGHESPLEHVMFTFAIQGISRAATHQLVRHRIASYSQQSQRYVNECSCEFIIPPAIAEHDDIRREYERLLDIAKTGYVTLIELFKRHGIDGRAATENARYVLPQAVETKIVVSMNVRELLHFFRLRCCNRAQWEIRTVAQKMLDICRLHLPAVFADAGPRCVWLGYCPEPVHLSCGLYPKRAQGKPNEAVQ